MDNIVSNELKEGSMESSSSEDMHWSMISKYWVVNDELVNKQQGMVYTWNGSVSMVIDGL